MDSGYRRPDPKGMWVRYTDHVDAIKRLQAEVERLQGICRGNAIRELELGEEIERLQATFTGEQTQPAHNSRVMAESVRTALHLATRYLIPESVMPSIQRSLRKEDHA